MPVIKAFDLAYGRIRSPDLDKQEEFLTDFGMVRADRTKNALYMRGSDPPHHIHVTELGEPRYVGIAVHAASYEDIERMSRVEGASKIEDIDEPGGGKRVRLTDPDGYQVEVVVARRMHRDPDIARFAQFGHVDVVRRIAAAHIEGVFGAIRPNHAEIGQKLLLLVEIGRANPPIGEIEDFDHRHEPPPSTKIYRPSLEHFFGAREPRLPPPDALAPGRAGR